MIRSNICIVGRSTKLMAEHPLDHECTGVVRTQGRLPRVKPHPPDEMRTFAYSTAARIDAGCFCVPIRQRGNYMNTGVGRARVGQWYLRWDKGEIFQVTGYDEASGTIEIQSFDGDLDEIEEDSWKQLPLGLAEPPEDWTGPVDDVERDDLGYSETDMRGADWTEPLQPFPPGQEAWEDTSEESAAVNERGSSEELDRLAVDLAR
jgi:Family of unknown function (DUF6763)